MNRRRSTRQPCAGRVTWSLANDRIDESGWMSDRSTGGIAFITTTGAAARPGDTIRIRQASAHRFAGCHPPQTYLVRHVQPYDERLSLIACQRMSDDRAQA